MTLALILGSFALFLVGVVVISAQIDEAGKRIERAVREVSAEVRSLDETIRRAR